MLAGRPLDVSNQGCNYRKYYKFTERKDIFCEYSQFIDLSTWVATRNSFQVVDPNVYHH